MALDEKKLIQRLKQSDEKAFNELFIFYHARIYNLCRKFLSSREDAKEIVQIVFIAVWENRFQIDEGKKFSNYILTIAHHWIYNYLKKRVHRQVYFEYFLSSGKDSLDFSTEDDIYLSDLKVLLEKLIEKLPPKRKEIFKLSRVEGLSYKEIGGRLSITESTVNSQITKAIEFIKQNLELYY